MTEYCKSHGYTVYKIYNDAGISAWKRYTKRPALLQLMEDCSTGVFDLVLFTKLDRWFRSVADYYSVQSVLDNNNVKWRAILEEYDNETSSGILNVNIMLSVSQAEADRMSDRSKDIIEYRRAQGKYIGKAPIGYKIVKSNLVIDQDKKEAVEAFFRTFEITSTMASAADAMRPFGVSIRRSTARNILMNETYTGNANGHKCEAYITREQYLRNKELAGRRIGTNSRKDRVYLFSGLLRCGFCGGRMDGNSRNSNGKQYLNYRCRNHYDLKTCPSNAFYFEKKLETYLLDCLEDEFESYKVSTSATAKKKDHSKERKALEAKLERIGTRFEDGDISIDEYRAKRDKIKADIAAIPVDEVKKMPSLPDDWEEVYKMLTKENRRAFWIGILKTIYVRKEGSEYLLNIDFL